MSRHTLRDSVSVVTEFDYSRVYRSLPFAFALALVAFGEPANAQIVEQNGASQQDSRASPTTPSRGMPETIVHESMKPQAKQAPKRATRRDSSKHKTTQSNDSHRADGGGGFQNGLYGTGTGSNK